MKYRRFLFKVVIPLLALYCLGYVICRQVTIIVHYSMHAPKSYTDTFHNVYSLHDVRAGEGAFNPEVAAFYTPLRYFELGYWHVAKPIGSPYP